MVDEPCHLEGYRKSKILLVFFLLYSGAVLISSICLEEFFVLFIFPMGLFGTVTENLETIPSFLKDISLFVGYPVYALILILALVYRKKKRFVNILFIVLILLLIFNIHGCQVIYENMGVPFYSP